ncbi:hypothetical protein BD626DRAFT_415300, partial [Schizophyllum amplum]
YMDCYARLDKASTRFSYHCAQLKSRQHAVKKTPGAKPRDKGSMTTFDCDGWLHITVWVIGTAAVVKMKHENDHIPYWRIDVPEKVQEFVRDNAKMTPQQLWTQILKKFPNPNYERQSIYRLWADEDRKLWRRHVDEKISAQQLLDEASRVQYNEESGEYGVQSIALPSIEGIDALAFSLPDVLRRWGSQIREIALDSAWNTNGSRYEIYGVLGEIYGSGCPIAYLLIRVNVSQEKGVKELYVHAVMSHLRDTWKIQCLVTLSDKDWAEINACRAKRLPIKDRAPAFYDVDEARREFEFIEKDFVPVGQIHTAGGVVSTVRTEVTIRPMRLSFPH